MIAVEDNDVVEISFEIYDVLMWAQGSSPKLATRLSTLDDPEDQSRSLGQALAALLQRPDQGTTRQLTRSVPSAHALALARLDFNHPCHAKCATTARAAVTISSFFMISSLGPATARLPRRIRVIRARCVE